MTKTRKRDRDGGRDLDGGMTTRNDHKEDRGHRWDRTGQGRPQGTTTRRTESIDGTGQNDQDGPINDQEGTTGRPINDRQQQQGMGQEGTKGRRPATATRDEGMGQEGTTGRDGTTINDDTWKGHRRQDAWDGDQQGMHGRRDASDPWDGWTRTRDGMDDRVMW